MSATVGEGQQDGAGGFRSPARVLVDWFRRSRDNWKCKYMDLKAELKKFKVRVSDIQKSRQRWRERAESSERELDVLRAEFEELRSQVSESVAEAGSAADFREGSAEKKRLRVCRSPAAPRN